MMKTIFPSIVIIILSACHNSSNNISVKSDSLSQSVASAEIADTVKWIDDFKAFREAVYHKQKQKLKAYFSFPIQNDPGALWYLVDADMATSTDSVKPFTEKDFDRHYEKIFPSAFSKAILKIKSAELYQKGEAGTIDLKENDSTTYRMSAHYYKKENSVTFGLNSATVLRDMDHVAEFSVIYVFNILPNGRLKFDRVLLAG